ncbi:MAG: methyltransferase domain-containing protein [Verrucomicrobia bacterium]|nr:methyltransferase domain-containing protein [Verrucomicrobiota bacterium]MDE3099583.1 methyltransferase domain-containing protein [Verrucomicrobiota bacterium]
MAQRILATLNDTRLFLQEWLGNPRRTGSVIPSSRQLAAAMAGWLPENRASYVLELGPGTGAVTAALIRNGWPEDKLVAIEHNSRLAELLRRRFPRATIIAGDAWQLDELLLRARNPVKNVGAVISSLPLLNFSEEQAEALAQKIRAVLEPQGSWVQFTYRIHKKRPRGASTFRLRASKIVWFNLPPARVSVFQK